MTTAPPPPAFDFPKKPQPPARPWWYSAWPIPSHTYDPSGAGYRFLADQILATDGFNPMIAARLVEPLGAWRRYRPELGALMKAELERIAATPGLSKNVSELVSCAPWPESPQSCRKPSRTPATIARFNLKRDAAWPSGRACDRVLY